MSVTLPDTLKVPKSVSDALVNDCDYYKVCNLDVSEFIDATFIASFIKSGKLKIYMAYAYCLFDLIGCLFLGTLTLLSVNRNIDCDDCIAITPSKNLILSLTKETYQSLGLEGVVSHFCANNKYKYRKYKSFCLLNLFKISWNFKLYL